MAGTNQRLDHIAPLDLLRLAAALAVVGFHYLFRGAVGETPYLDAAYPEAASIAIYGYLGVSQFFLISGFVIAWSAEGRSWHEFALARFARLYPGFVVCMTITFVVMLLAAAPAFPVSARQYVANLTMFAPALGQPFMDGAYWSIVLEVIFYGWVALALFFGVFSRLKLELVLGWLFVSLANEFFLHSGALRLLLLTEYGPLFAAGVLIHHMYGHGRSSEALMLLAAAFMLSCLNMTIQQEWMLAHYGTQIALPNLILANAVMHALLVGALLLRDRVRPSGLMLALGGLTYPLYLLHQHVGYVAIDALAPSIGRWPAALACTVALTILALVVWRFVERPAQRFLRRHLSGPVAAIGSRLRLPFAPGPGRL